MTGSIACPCCDRAVPVTEDEIGTTTVCPRTRRPFAVTRIAFRPDGLPEPLAPASAGSTDDLWTPIGPDDAPAPTEPATPVKRTTPNQPDRLKTPERQGPPRAEPSRPVRPWLARQWVAVTAGALACVTVAVLVGWASRSAPPPPETAAVHPAVESAPPTDPDPKPLAPLPPVPEPQQPERPSANPEPVGTTPPVSSPSVPAPKEAAVPSAPVDPKPVDPKSAEPKPQVDDRGFTVHALTARLDNLKADDIQQQLHQVTEVSLDQPGATRVMTDLTQFARVKRQSKEFYPGTIVALKWRPDLAGLPFQVGAGAILPKERATAMDSRSKQLREAIQGCVRKGEAQPDTDDLYATLISGTKGEFGKRDRAVWATAEAVPCISQMLQPENREVRRMSCELLKGLGAAEATEALVRWAVFDADAGNRAAAVAALKDRDPKDVAPLLLAYVRYPWPRAVEHACEALVALDCRGAVPQLAAAYNRPDPDAPFWSDLPWAKGTYRREVVRVNHLRNCVMCHAPSFEATDLVRGAVPDPNRPIPVATTPSYYNQSSQFVTASVTYLRQDFSVPQPVAKEGNWPKYQRYDYFVVVRKDTGTPARKPAADSPYRKAYAFALQKLGGHDPAAEPEWVSTQRAAAGANENLAEIEAVARFASIQANPDALAAIKYQDYERALLGTAPDELTRLVERWQYAHGSPGTRLALVAHFAPLTQTGDAPDRARAARGSRR